MPSSAWIELSKMVVGRGTPAGQLISLLTLFSSTVTETEDELAYLIESPITAGKGLLYRAEREPSRREELVTQAQYEFTKLILHDRKPMLASRASFFVGVCHQLLKTEPNITQSYFADSFRLAMQAVEQCERERFAVFNPWNFLGEVDRQNASAKKKYGILYRRIDCVDHPNGSVVHPLKDEYMKSLEDITRVTMPICCVDRVDELCQLHRPPKFYVSGSHKNWRTFSATADYSKAKEIALRGLQEYAKPG